MADAVPPGALCGGAAVAWRPGNQLKQAILPIMGYGFLTANELWAYFFFLIPV